VSRSMHGPVPRQLARVLANLPEKVRVTWADHQLHGTELPVHAWHRLQGEIHLVVTLPDGSRGYLPASRTALFEAQERDPALILTGDSVRQLRQLVEAFQARSRRHRRAMGPRSK
jgi:hypothetical protein